MNKKKLLSKLVVASVMVGGINFLPVPNFDAENFQSSIAYAEVKTITASDATMSDIVELTETAKKVAYERAIKAAQERAGVYVSSYSRMVKGRLTYDDITAVTNSVLEVMDVKYRKLLYQAADENGNRFGKVGEMYEATVTVKIDTDGISEYIKRTAQEKAKLIQQAKDSQAAFEEINKNYEDLRKNLKNKTPQQIQAESKKIDDKISAQQKKRDKNKSSNKKTTTPKGKTKTTEKKTATPVNNVPMQFSQVVKIGSLFVTPSSGTVIEKADYISSQPVNKFDGKKTYSNFTARWGDETNGIYCHFNNYPPKFGGKNDSIAVDMGPFASIEQIQNSKNMPLYMIILGNYDVRYTEFYLIGKRPDGRWVKYFDTKTIKQSYPLLERAYLSNKCSVRGDTVIIPCEQLQGRNQVAVGEFCFKWDEKAQWFGVEKITYQNNTAPQKTTENNPVTSQPMQFSTPVEIGSFGLNLRSGGIGIREASYISEKPKKVSPNLNTTTYSNGVARFGNGAEALYLHYASMSNPVFKIGSENVQNTISYNCVWTTIFKVNATNGYKMYFLRENGDVPAPYKHYTLVGLRPDGKWVKYFNTEDLCKQYMGSSKNVSIQKITSNGDTIIAEYARSNHPSHGNYFYEMEADEFGEFRFKWDDKARWFGIEKVVYSQVVSDAKRKKIQKDLKEKYERERAISGYTPAIGTPVKL